MTSPQTLAKMATSALGASLDKPCGYGTAHSLVCPPVAWAYTEPGYPYVAFEDHTITPAKDTWHVGEAATLWNSVRIPIGIHYWTQMGSGCDQGEYCVRVDGGNYGATGWIGYTNVYWRGTNIVRSDIKLNEYYLNQMPDDVPRKTACHELGHSLGRVTAMLCVSRAWGSPTLA